ncbi:MAG TPA: HPF/RaiA family ribosome-associated protein [Polyangiaceae bacterium]|nr:HPF/RaiA family ribosome-associated protein [Polyangiaceae bacterium]
MHIYVTARHFDLTPSIHSYVEKRLVEATQGHAASHDLLRMEVQLTQLDAHDARFTCHILLQLRGHHDINITEETFDLYEAVDRAEKRLIRKLTDERQRQLTAARHAKLQDLEPLDDPSLLDQSSR